MPDKRKQWNRDGVRWKEESVLWISLGGTFVEEMATSSLKNTGGLLLFFRLFFFFFFFNTHWSWVPLTIDKGGKALRGGHLTPQIMHRWHLTMWQMSEWRALGLRQWQFSFSIRVNYSALARRWENTELREGKGEKEFYCKGARLWQVH